MLNTDVVTALYDATLQPALWTDALDRVHPLVNASGAALLVSERTPNDDGVIHEFMNTSKIMNTEHLPIYNQSYTHHERGHVSKVFQSEPGSVVVDEAFEDRETIIQRPVHGEFKFQAAIGVRYKPLQWDCHE